MTSVHDPRMGHLGTMDEINIRLPTRTRSRQYEVSLLTETGAETRPVPFGNAPALLAHVATLLHGTEPQPQPGAEP